MIATMNITQKEIYSIQIPKNYPITDEKLKELVRLNPDLELSLTKNNTLNISALTFEWFDYEQFPLRVPDFTFELFQELYEEHNSKYNQLLELQFYEEGEIILTMGTIGIISALTAAILISIGKWALTRKSGKVYSEAGCYVVENQSKEGQFFQVEADVSYIDYSRASKAEQSTYKHFIPIPPSMVMEIVSSKYGLKGDLRKMENVWMQSGADVGIVVCPYTKQIYIFEKAVEGYKIQSISEDFSHPLLPDYKDNFSSYLDGF